MQANVDPRIGSVAMQAIAGLYLALKDTPDISKLNEIFAQVIQLGMNIMTRQDYIDGGHQTPVIEAFNDVIENCDKNNLKGILKELASTLCS